MHRPQDTICETQATGYYKCDNPNDTVSEHRPHDNIIEAQATWYN